MFQTDYERNLLVAAFHAASHERRDAMAPGGDLRWATSRGRVRRPAGAWSRVHRLRRSSVVASPSPGAAR